MYLMVDRVEMTPEEFRRHGYAMIDWLAGYMERVGELPVQSGVKPDG